MRSWSTAAIRSSTEQKGAERKTAHEYGEYHSLGICRRPDQLHQQFGPDYLVHQRGEAAEEKGGKDRALRCARNC